MLSPKLHCPSSLTLHLMDDSLISLLAHVIRSLRDLTSSRGEAWRYWVGSVSLRQTSSRRLEGLDAGGNRYDDTERIDAQQVRLDIEDYCIARSYD